MRYIKQGCDWCQKCLQWWGVGKQTFPPSGSLGQEGAQWGRKHILSLRDGIPPGWKEKKKCYPWDISLVRRTDTPTPLKARSSNKSSSLEGGGYISPLPHLLTLQQNSCPKLKSMGTKQNLFIWLFSCWLVYLVMVFKSCLSAGKCSSQIKMMQFKHST